MRYSTTENDEIASSQAWASQKLPLAAVSEAGLRLWRSVFLR